MPWATAPTLHTGRQDRGTHFVDTLLVRASYSYPAVWALGVMGQTCSDITTINCWPNLLFQMNLYLSLLIYIFIIIYLHIYHYLRSYLSLFTYIYRMYKKNETGSLINISGSIKFCPAKTQDKKIDIVSVIFHTETLISDSVLAEKKVLRSFNFDLS